ncbi:putative alpha-1,2-mannosidase [Anseongella ginsenosidimutans]|uniref:Putative alpha-1,2-mannosidase n=1 Tax=Anseongella ginsenosidimutans TaxID=496056 RepID=A0A4R3KR46_9SPHI|nr:GH92 family glycosyl hydrolase [Anseongella ginsenosidimutans]QEC52620.1 hypothetical protein FRZ59_09910 [Anseongella ginsenosidimutans]TCS86543.1 putative alpha-1,2-mannosidase [Anseongella ginsenosidimutans]
MRILTLATYLLFVVTDGFAQAPALWKIGENDGSTRGMALEGNAYGRFIEHDFGFEDGFFLAGYSAGEEDFPYVLPGPASAWGGTGPTAGIRSHFLNIYFEVGEKGTAGDWRFVLDVLDTDPLHPPLVKITVNGAAWKRRMEKGSGMENPDGEFSNEHEQLFAIELPDSLIREGFNEITITTLEGGWLAFDQVKLESSTGSSLLDAAEVLVREVKSASYEIKKENGLFQPLLLDILHLSGTPSIRLELDGKPILDQTAERGAYVLEAPMPAVQQERTSRYSLFINGKLAKKGSVKRFPARVAGPAGYVNTLMGTGHSRWMIAPGPWMPFSMVKLSPDNQDGGWQAGYDPTFESIGTFSHIHEWTMAGLGTFPVNGPLQIRMGNQNDPESGYRSRIDKSTEAAPLGYYQVRLSDYDITAELTATTRAGFQRYTYHQGDTGRIMIDLLVPAEYGYQIRDFRMNLVGDRRIEGYSHQLSKGVWSGGVNQDYIVHFVIEFDRPVINAGAWLDGKVKPVTALQSDSAENAGMYVEFDVRDNRSVQMRSAISYVSIENAALNLETEISRPFGWDFNAVRGNQENTWNELLSRLQIFSADRREKMRFYTNMYRSLASRNIFSDVDGRWVDAGEQVRQFKDPADVALGCDAFWNTFWNLNQFWNLVTPEWSEKWVKSQLAMYDTGGWLAKGPAGMEYIPVMVAEHEIPLIVAAYQMGIRDFDVEKAFKAVYKMQTTPPEWVGGGLAGNLDLVTYLEHHYVPYDEGRFSNSLEYSFDDWAVSQFAKALGKDSAWNEFRDRGTWWRNAIDPETGYARMRDAAGEWLPDFDPFKSGANHHYVEGNAWQLTFFVPQDVPGLAGMIGKDDFTERLEWGFEESYKWRFNGPNDQYWDYPVVQGNQQSMHFAYLFNWVEKPWLSQKWSRAIADRYYGYGVSNAYLGDEDQGQMSAWFVMNALGLFQIDGGARANPIYEIGSPLFEKTVIDLGERYGRGRTFTIEARNSSRKNKYVQKATLNGKPLQNFWFDARELLKGGSLVLEMGPEPNQQWGRGQLPPAP